MKGSGEEGRCGRWEVVTMGSGEPSMCFAAIVVPVCVVLCVS